MRSISVLDVTPLPVAVLELALEYWWITGIAALLVIGAAVGIVLFTKKHKKSDKETKETLK